LDNQDPGLKSGHRHHNTIWL